MLYRNKYNTLYLFVYKTLLAALQVYRMWNKDISAVWEFRNLKWEVMLVTVGNIAFSTGKDVCSADADVVLCLKTGT